LGYPSLLRTKAGGGRSGSRGWKEGVGKVCAAETTKKVRTLALPEGETREKEGQKKTRGRENTPIIQGEVPRTGHSVIRLR